MALQDELNKQGEFLFRNRSFLPLLFLIIALWAYLETELNEIETEDTWFTEIFEFVCLGCSLFGLFLRIITVGYTPGSTSGRNTKDGQVADALNTTGMYSITRHPLYLGNFFMWLGLAMLTENIWFIAAFVLLFTLYYERIMYTEEMYLHAKFGPIYSDWADHTPAFIPSFRKFSKPAYSFSWKKILKKEKNGFAAVFLLFWFFEFIGECIEDGSVVLEFNFWFYSAVTSVIIYLVLKIMKRKKLLNEAGR